MDKKVKSSEIKNLLMPIKNILKSRITKENFDYSISLISKIPNKIERLKTFNQFMENVYVKVSQGETTQEVSDIISKTETQAPEKIFLFRIKLGLDNSVLALYNPAVMILKQH